MIRRGEMAVAVCDGCGEEGEAYEARNPRTGTLSWGFLPSGWKYDRIEGEDVHRCAECAAGAVDPFGERREAFEARLEQLGGGLVADISMSLSIPDGIGRRWAAEWAAKTRRAA